MRRLTQMMTDPNPPQASLPRCSVSESDMDPMITTTLRNDPRRFIPSGRSKSQPNILGLGPCTDSNRQP